MLTVRIFPRFPPPRHVTATRAYIRRDDVKVDRKTTAASRAIYRVHTYIYIYKYSCVCIYIYAYRISLFGSLDTQDDGGTWRGGGEGLKGVQTDTAIELPARPSVRSPHFSVCYIIYYIRIAVLHRHDRYPAAISFLDAVGGSDESRKVPIILYYYADIIICHGVRVKSLGWSRTAWFMEARRRRRWRHGTNADAYARLAPVGAVGI